MKQALQQNLHRAFDQKSEYQNQRRSKELEALRFDEILRVTQADFRKIEPILLRVNQGSINEGTRIPKISKRQEVLLLSLLKAEQSAFSVNQDAILATHLSLLFGGDTQLEKELESESSARTYGDLRRHLESSKDQVHLEELMDDEKLGSSERRLLGELHEIRIEIAEMTQLVEREVHRPRRDGMFSTLLGIGMGLLNIRLAIVIGRLALFKLMGPVGWALLASDLVLGMAHLIVLSRNLRDYRELGRTQPQHFLGNSFGQLGKPLEVLETITMYVGLGSAVLSSKGLGKWVRSRAKRIGLRSFNRSLLRAYRIQTRLKRSGVARLPDGSLPIRAFRVMQKVSSVIRVGAALGIPALQISAGQKDSFAWSDFFRIVRLLIRLRMRGRSGMQALRGGVK